MADTDRKKEMDRLLEHSYDGIQEYDNPMPRWWVLSFWGTIIFAVLYILLSRSALPGVASVIEERARHIASDLETAQAAKARSDEAARQVAEATARARAEAQAQINAALDAAKQEAAGRIAALNERLEKQLHEAEAQIGDTERAAARPVLVDLGEGQFHDGFGLRPRHQRGGVEPQRQTQ